MNPACAGKPARLAYSLAAMVALSAGLAPAAHAAAQSRPQSMLADAAPSASTAPSTPESQPANQITLNLLVHGKKNKPVPDLSPADISLADAGTPISSGEIHLSPGAESGDRLVTFLFDRLDAGSADRAAKAARKILKDLSGRHLEIAVLAVDRHLRILQPFTSDITLAGNAIGQTAGRRAGMEAAATAQEKAMAAPANAAADPALQLSQRLWNESTFDAARRAEQIASEQHTPPGMASLVAIASSQRKLPGRKVIVYFTQDTPSDLEAADDSRAAAEVLRDASVSAFVVDMNTQDAGTAEGMQAAMAVVGAPRPTMPAPGAASSTPPGMFRQVANTVNQIEFGGLDSTRTPLGQLAESTGGIYATSDLNTRKVSRRIIGDLTDYYTVTYPASTSKLDGNFHTVSVRAVRSGLKLETQPGYFASPIDSGPESDPGDSTLLQAVEGSPAASDLTLRTALLRYGNSSPGLNGKTPTGLKAVLAVEVPIRQLDLRVDANTNLFSIHVVIAGEIKDQAGAPIAHFHQEIRRHGAADAVDEVLPQSLSVQRTISLAPGDYQVEAVVQDQNSGKIGRSTRTIHLSEADAKAAAHADASSGSQPGFQPESSLAAFSGPGDLSADAAPSTAKPLTPEESAALLAGARKQAITYGEKLPNFLCVETIDRSIDGSGRGEWKHLDTISELLRYLNHAETRTILRVDGKRSSLQPEDITGARSMGEFGGILQIVFDPAAEARFKWERSETQSGSTLQVFSFTVDAAHSDFIVMDTGSQRKAAFHGLVYIDADTRAVRRIVAQTDLMKSTNIHASWMEVYYDYFAINGHDYLLPARGEVGLRQGRRAVIQNKLRFTGYRRFGSRTRILGMSPVAAAATP